MSDQPARDLPIRDAPIRDAVRLCLGTLTIAPVPPPGRLDRGRAGMAMVLAPLAGALVGVVVGTVALAADAVGLPGLVIGAAAVGTGALATRLLHLDGVADTADGMAAVPHGGDTQRALDVMRRGDVGPAGVVAVVLVVIAQVAALATMVENTVVENDDEPRAIITVVLAWAISRAVLPLLCTSAFAPARPGGLGATVLRSVTWPAAIGVAAMSTAVAWSFGGWPAALVASLALAAGVLVAAAVARRLGGLTGDVLGASVEVALLVALSGAAALSP